MAQTKGGANERFPTTSAPTHDPRAAANLTSHTGDRTRALRMAGYGTATPCRLRRIQTPRSRAASALLGR